MKRDAIKQETLTPPESVSYFVYRADLAREARHTAWWRAFAIALAAVMIAAVVWFFWRESEFADVEFQQRVEQEADNGGSNNSTVYMEDYYGYEASRDYDN